ncbi:MAG TPA: GatB/YqeY domain-containing protein [Dehalococcoidia bacterium]|nr:GatB/YqeY domain-containing protein [Dehalococcoidia bacterium]
MALKEQISNDLKEAMRSGDALRRDVMRSVLTAISNAEIARVDTKDESAARTSLEDDAVVGVLRKQAKQRRDSIEEYAKAGRQDLVDRERGELEIITEYLPAEMSRDDIAREVAAVIAEAGATGPGDKGKVMPLAMQRLKGRADGRVINEVVTDLLSR